jgi:hypothetical protein
MILCSAKNKNVFCNIAIVSRHAKVFTDELALPVRSGLDFERGPTLQWVTFVQQGICGGERPNETACTGEMHL